jgi:hypothetical protein
MKSMLLGGLAGALIVGVLVAGFLALDKTTLHWYADSNGHASASFSALDVQHLTESAIADGGFSVPSNTHFAKCPTAVFFKTNRKWLVTCEFRETSGAAPIATREFVFDDRAGQVQAATK